MENYVALDLETTGLSPKNDRILEIGAVKIEEGRETGRIATLIDPQMKIPERITALTGISQEMVKGMPVNDVISRLEGVRCGRRSTSCPDQLCRALHEMGF